MQTKTARQMAGGTALATSLSRFAAFAGLGKPKADDAPATVDDVEEVDEKVDDVADDVDDLEKKVDQLEDEVDDKVDEDDAPAEVEPGDDKPAEQAAFRRGQAAGARTERTRCSTIIGSKAAATNPVLALHLAFNTTTKPGAAVSLLRASAAGAPAPARAAGGPAASKLDARMSTTRQPVVGAASGAAPDRNTAQGASAFCIAAAAKARGK